MYLELVEPCEHGYTHKHMKDHKGQTEAFFAGGNPDDDRFFCPGGSRRSLTEPTAEMVKATAGAIYGQLPSALGGHMGFAEHVARIALTAAFRSGDLRARFPRHETGIKSR